MRNESLNIWGRVDVVHILNILNINSIPNRNSLDQKLIILACGVKDRKRGSEVRWENWRVGELVYWFPEPPSSLLPPLPRWATSHTQYLDLNPLTDWANQQTSFLSSHHSALKAGVTAPALPIQSFVRQNNNLSQTGKSGNKDPLTVVLWMILLCP